MKSFLKTFFIFTAIIVTSMADGPGKGMLKKPWWGGNLGGCKISSITVQWDLDSDNGQAIARGVYRVDGPSHQSCKMPPMVVWLRMTTENGGTGFVRLTPSTPNINEGFGTSDSGIQSWNQLVCSYRGSQKRNCFSKKNAELFWSTGRVIDFHVEADLSAL